VLTEDDPRLADLDHLAYWQDVVYSPALAMGAGGAAALPEIAGGSPGLFDDLTDVFDWVKGETLDPVIAFLSDKVSSLIRDIWGTVEAVLNRVFYHMYDWTRQLVYFLVPNSEKVRFPEAVTFAGGPATFYIAQTISLVVWAVRGMVDIVGNFVVDTLFTHIVNTFNWVTQRTQFVVDTLFTHIVNTFNWVTQRTDYVVDAILSGLGSATTTVGNQALNFFNILYSGINATRSYLSTIITSLLDRIYAGVVDVVDVLADVYQWTRFNIPNLLGTLFDRVGSVYDFVSQDLPGIITRDIPNFIVAGAQSILGEIVDLLQSIFIGPLNEVVAFGQGKVDIVRRLIRGEHPDAVSFLEDLLDPPDWFWATIGLPVIIGGLVVGGIGVLFSALGPIMYESLVQDFRMRYEPALLTIEQTHEAWNRDIIDEATAEDNLRRLGLGSEVLRATKELRFNMPSPSDSVRFGVREVFTPAIAEVFRQFEEFPAGFGQVMELLGYPASGGDPSRGSAAPGGRSWAEAYWAAHWDLPSITQAFEMLHRRVTLDDGSPFDSAALDRLLRAADVMPFWRGPLTQISYNPLTRVDIRRLFSARLLDRTGVYNANLDRGYNPANAELLTRFTEQNYSPDEQTTADVRRDLTASNIRLSYRRHIIDRDDAVDRLVDIGYDPEEADFLLAQDDAQLALNPTTDAGVDVRELTLANILTAYRERVWDRDRAQLELEVLGYLSGTADLMLELEELRLARDLKDARVRLVREQYVAFDLGPTQARDALTAADVHPDHQTVLLAEWEVDRQRGTRKLSVAEIFVARRDGALADDDAFAYLLRLGYNEADATIIFNRRAA
jgi:hypothetical protein